jgi:thiamine pyrophosphate-dependent acetolactate synthase large subunit-like protein
MKVSDAIAEILRREGVETVIGYPVNHILERGAAAGIRPILVRQERTGLHMADAMSRVTSGDKLGVFVMQHGPGTENSYGAVAQAFGDSIPVLVMPGGYPRQRAWVERNYNASVQMRGITKSAEPIIAPAELSAIMRRAFTQLRSGRGGPVLVEVPQDVWNEETDISSYVPSRALRSGPDPVAIREAASMLLAAKRPVLYVGQGVHWAKAWGELKVLAEWLAIPVCTSLQGKSAFPETHPLALGSGGLAYPATVHHFLKESDLILGIGCSFSTTNYGVAMPKGKNHPCDTGCRRRQQRRSLRARGARRCQAHPGCADRRSFGHAEVAARLARGRQGNKRHPRSLARQMDGQAHPQRGAVLALSGAVGSAEHRRHRQHDHHA